MSSSPPALTVDLRQMVIAIETAVSLVGMNDTNHGKRVGFLATQIAKHLGFSDHDLQFAFDLGMLHDCGVSTEQMHSNLVNHFDWIDAHIHCEIGYRLLKDFKPLAEFAKPILHHHTRWDELAGCSLSLRDMRMANLIFLADRIDVLSAVHYEKDILLARKEVIESIAGHSGTYFDPEIVAALRDVSGNEALWIGLEARHITRYVWDMGQLEETTPLTLNDLKQLSLIMSYIVDQKSPFTAQHSVRVADLSKFLAITCGLSREQCDKVEIAGLLHDLGKLNTPDHILEKPGPLSEIERSNINQHSYETYEILRHIHGIGEVALWAAYHHECINGAGYPFHPSKQDMSTEARIIAVADVFQALVQNRPYRNGMELERVLSILDEMARVGKIDPAIVAVARQYGDRCFEIARGTDPVHNRPCLDLFEQEPSIIVDARTKLPGLRESQYPD